MPFNWTSELLQQDADYLLLLIQEGVLTVRDKERFPGTRGTLNFVCADGDQFVSVIDKHRQVCDGRNCHHTFAINGLPLRVAPESPVALGFESELYLREAAVAFTIKDLDTICLLPHWPCGVGVGGNLSLQKQLQLCSQGKFALRSHLDAEGIGPFDIVINLRIDSNPLIPRLAGEYHFDRHAWGNFEQKQQSLSHIAA